MGKSYFFFGSSNKSAKQNSVARIKKSCFFKTPYLSENLSDGNEPIYIENKEQKRLLMREKNLEEV